jgi:adenylate cyclase
MAETKWKNSIAVLPFADISLQKDQEYFCDGMTEDIITKLSRFEELKVISRTSVMRYKRAYKDIKEIGKELGVETILEGSIRREKDNIRVNAQLVNVEDGFQLWADIFDRKLESVFEVQNEVSQAIADALKIKLTPKRVEALKVGRPRNIDAYEYVLKGMHFINSKYVISHREDDFKTAVKMLRKAYELEPNSVFAYTSLCWAYQHHYQITGNRADLALVIQNAGKAYEISPNLVETNGAIAWVYFLKGEQDEAYLSYKKALEINKNIPGINHLISLFFRNLGLLWQSIEYSSRNIELDPFFLPAHSVRNRCLVYTGELEKASAAIRKSLEVEPNNFWSLQDYSLFSLAKGKIDEAEKFLDRIEKISPNYPGNKFYKALLLAAKGEKKKALAFQKNGVIYSFLGMKDKALNYIDKEIAKGKEHFQYSYLPLAHSSFYDNLRDEPRFQDILKEQEKNYEERLRKYGKL